MMMQTITGYRLSPQQKQVWQEQQQRTHEDATANDCAQLLLSVSGNLDVARLREAANAVVLRHEILRTSFPRRPGMRTPMQVIQEQPEASSVRVAIERLSPEDHRLLVTLPALCADVISLGIIAREIFQAYTTGPGWDANEPVQYIQFSEWQHELSESEHNEAGRAFWLEQQSASIPVLVSKCRDTNELIKSILDHDVSTQLDRVATECKVSTETVLLTCWVAVLHRLTAQETFSVNCVFNGRQYEELQDAVGLFARALPLSFRLHGPQTFAELAQQIEQRRLEAMEWQEYFDSGSDMTAGVGFEYVEQSREWTSAGSLKWRILETRAPIHRPKLGLRCVKTDEATDLELVGDEVQRLLSRMQMLVKGAVENVHQPIAGIRIVDHNEWNYLIDQLSHSDDESVAEPQDFIQMFESAAERFSDQPAVVGEDEVLTYAELDRRANQLAHYLRSLGVGPETRVAICLKRSVKMIAAILGVLKSGGAYVPLDFTYSRKQLSYMLEDAAAPVLLTQQSLLAALPEHTGRNLCLDTKWSAIATESNDRPSRVVTDENLAYVIYTSGSTGAPKGVGIEHRQLQNYLRSILHRLDLPAGASYATVSTFAADLGNTVIFPALATGGCLHVVSQDRATNPDALAEYFDRHRIDCVKIVPSHLQALLETSTPAKVLPRRCLVLGGEALRADMVRRIQELAPDCRVLNHYGPTETTVGVLTHPVNGDNPDRAGKTLPLGRPLAGTQIYLLDRNLAPAPFGVAATIYVGGESVSRGYLNRPDLTAERFVPNPFGPAGTRLYHTGDLARYLPEGNIEFLGRNDNQVKIHGYRVELGEIECALLQHEAVRETAVIIREDAAGEKRLGAYVVCRQNHIPTADELREFLIARLAAHLVPAEFVLLKSLPLNANGKLDRRALTETDGVSLELNRSFVAPRTAVEEVLAAIWSDVLKQERVGVEDNFFALGGHSLAAMQVMARVRKVFQAELSLRTVFESTTVALLAQAIVRNETEPGLSERKARVWKKLAAMSPEEKEALRDRQKRREEQLVGAAMH